MTIYDRGRFRIEADARGRRVRYELRSLHVMLFCLLAVPFAFGFGAVDGGLSGGALVAAAGFGWIYGMNWLTGRVRVRGAVRRAVSGASG
jgi:hypothetical protein